MSPDKPAEGFDVIPMWVADMNFKTAPSIVEAIRERLEHPLFGYFTVRDEYYQKILDEGHSLGIHTYSHVYGDIYESLDSFVADFEKMRNHIFEQTGEMISLYRFPGGSGNNVVSATVREEIFQWLEQEGIHYYDWNVSSGDAEKNVLSAERIAQNCIDGVKNCNTAIVLLHDAGGKKSTIEALPLIIEGINQLDDTILLPMDEETVKIQQIKSTNE